MLDWLKVPWDSIEAELEKRVSGVFDKVFDTIDDCENELNKLKDSHPKLNELALAHEVIGETCKRTATIGGVAAAPSIVPGLGWTAMIATLAGDYCLTLREEMTMFMKFSFLFDPDENVEQRKKDVISLLLFLASDRKNNVFAKEVLQDLQKQQIDVIARKLLVRTGVQLGLRFFRRKLLSVLPGIGIALSGGVNYLGTKSMGKLGIQYFQNKAEFIRVHGQSSSNLEVTSRCVVQMQINLSKMADLITPEMKSSIFDNMDIFGYSDEEKQSYNEDMDKSEITPISIKDIRAMTDEDKRYVLKQGLKIVGKDPLQKQKNYLEFITRAFGLTQNDMNRIQKELFEESSQEK